MVSEEGLERALVVLLEAVLAASTALDMLRFLWGVGIRGRCWSLVGRTGTGEGGDCSRAWGGSCREALNGSRCWSRCLCLLIFAVSFPVREYPDP